MAALSVIELWLTNKIYHKENKDYLINQLGIKSIGIYGAGKYGQLLYDDLLESDIDIKYFIDENADSLYYGIDDMNIYNLQEIKNVDHVDAIIVTPINSFNEIKNNLDEVLGYTPMILSLEEIVCKTE